jgi:soluble lytic murein transglycosylase-like protein
MATRSKTEDTLPLHLSDRGWRTLALNGLAFLAVVNGALALYAFREVESLRAEIRLSLWRTEQRYQSLNAQVSFASDRRRLLLGVRDEILKTRPELGVTGAYELASLVLEASEKYPSVDPLLLVAVGIVESGYDVDAISGAGARGLYQIHPSTGRLLARARGWEYSDDLLHDPAKSTEMAACYLDLLQTTYDDAGMVLAEYNGGPVNAGAFRAQAGALATETKDYVSRVLHVYERLARELGDHRGETPFPILSAAEKGDSLSLSARPTPTVPAPAAGQ